MIEVLTGDLMSMSCYHFAPCSCDDHFPDHAAATSPPSQCEEAPLSSAGPRSLSPW